MGLKVVLLQSKLNELMDQVKRLELKNRRLESALFVLRRHTVNIEYSLRNSSNVNNQELASKIDQILRTVEVLEQENLRRRTAPR